MLRLGVALLGCVLLSGCGAITVNEATLSNNQRVAMVSTPGDGVSPPTNLVLLQGRGGAFAPVATGFGQAVVPSMLAGAAAGVAVGAGMYGAARVAKPTQITQTQNGASATAVNSNSNSNFALGGSGGLGFGGSGGSGFGGTAISTATSF